MTWIKDKNLNPYRDNYSWLTECDHVRDEFKPWEYFDKMLFNHSKEERLKEMAELEKDHALFRAFSDQLRKQLDAGTLTEEQYLKLLLDYQCRDK